MVIILWVIIIVAAIINREREREYRTENVKHRVEYINKRLASLYGQGQDMSKFLQVLEDYFHTGSLQDMSIAIYDEKGEKCLYEVGFDAPSPALIDMQTGWIKADELDVNNDLPFNSDMTFYYAVQKGDGMVAQSILPMSEKVENVIKAGSWWMVFAIIAGAIVTCIAYYSTRHLTRNVRLLKQFADNAANNRDFAAIDDFPDDELGDISRQIVSIHNARSAAIASREFEHRVALKATRDRAKFKRQMTNNINHELKTPVGIIKGYIDTIMENPDMDADAKNHFLKKTQDQVERLVDLLNDLSTMTRLEDGSAKLIIEEIDLNSFMNDFAEEVEDAGIAKEMTFITELPENCLVKGNRTMLNAALMNLTKNAANYSHGTELGLKYLNRNRKLLTFSFFDNGTGVDEEHIPHLFERFYRVDHGRSRKAGGTGLGLPIVMSCINAMGGSISVRNGEQGGLEFIFTLPAVSPSKKRDNTPTIDNDSPSSSDAAPPKDEQDSSARSQKDNEERV